LQIEAVAREALRCQCSPEEGSDDDTVVSKKRRFIKWDWERARHAIRNDYWGPTPSFSDCQFERVFRVSRSVADRLMNLLAQDDAFFTERFDALGKLGICPKAKLLMGLKLLGYGISPSGFQAYFQMGFATARQCLLHLVKGLSTNINLQQEYLKPITRIDAKRVSSMHRYEHGIEGMLGSLDCMHIRWKNCPTAWQGQYKGSKGKPTIVLETFSDYSMWIWHVAFSSPGTLNDINIWDRSPLLKSFIDGTFKRDVDMEFEIGEEVFSEMWLLVDGIYPPLSRFVQTLEVPTTHQEHVFANWQEAARKSIERTFGCLQRKFHVLVKPIEQWYVYEITEIVLTCCILHNMMVQQRIHRSEQETEAWYEGVDEAVEAPVDASLEAVERQQAELDLHSRIEHMFYDGSAVSATKDTVFLKSVRQAAAMDRWERLYDEAGNVRLRNAIIRQLEKNAHD
jgi:Plant transposon protein